MTRRLDWRFPAPLFATLWIGGALSMPPSLASQSEITENTTKSATAGPFASAAEAEAFLTRALPEATDANPKYRSPDSDVERRWLTTSIAFHQSDNGGVIVSSHEAIEDYRGGALSSRGTHEATFEIDEVRIAEETTSDVAENGEQARAVMFRCVGAPCIRADWSGQKSVGASTDIYIQYATQRQQILAAFQALQRKLGSQ